MPKNTLSIECVGLGKRVSTSIDRFFQNSSMTEGREREGSFETRLYTNLDGIEIEQEIKPQNKQSYTDTFACPT